MNVVPSFAVIVMSASMALYNVRTLLSRPLNTAINTIIAATGIAIATILTLDMWLIIECEFLERIYRPAIKYRNEFNIFI